MMKKLKSSMAAKLIALILFCVFTLSLTAGAVGSSVMESWDAYSTDYDMARAAALKTPAFNKLYESYDMYLDGMELDEISEETNFRFTISDAKGKKLYSNYKNEDIISRVIVDMEPRYHLEHTQGAAGVQDIARSVIYHETGEILTFATDAEYEKWRDENSKHVTGYVLAAMTANDELAQRDWIFNILYTYRYELIAAAVASAIMLIILIAFMVSAAGHRKDSDEIVLSFVDRIPLDVFLCVATVMIFAPIPIASEMRLQLNIVGLIVAGLVIIWTAVSALVTLMSLAVRIKSKTLWTNCLCLRFCRWCWRMVKKFFAFCREMLSTLPMDRRWTVCIAAALLAEVFLLMLSGFNEGMLLLLWFINLAAFLVFLIWAINGFIKLRAGAKQLASGSLTCTIDTKYMRGELKEHAEDLMNIREGLNRAVNERMKSERFQSELITNVSHDIKTPLTSIVNYVDLLAKEELANDKAREYVTVLIRQSEKLKKLIGDLIEASKASTGVLAVNRERVELTVLMDQCAGEYKERLENAGLRLMVSKPEGDISIMADGRHMWRIFDNLMNNVIKYAQPGTRVYLSLNRANDKAIVVLRNISRDELNLSGEELMERFVRGDSSRSGEGSGLGLAIARSLCQLQGGEMSLDVDGDLFKVTLKFNTI